MIIPSDDAGIAPLHGPAEYFNGGIGRIIEPVTTTGTPLTARRTRLVDQRTGRLVAEAVSDPADGGNVAFAGLALDRPYLLYAIDESQAWQAVQISHRVATVTGARPGAA